MSALKIKDDQGNWINLPGLKGDKGDKGDKGESGVYLGTTAPSDEDINVWINPNGEAHTEAVVVDPTLTMEGQAADAKVVGDRFGAIENGLDSIKETSIEDYDSINYQYDDVTSTATKVTGKFINNASSDIIRDNSNWNYYSIPAQPFDVFQVDGYQNSSVKSFYFLDDNDTILAFYPVDSISALTRVENTAQAPVGTTKIYVNEYASYLPSVIRKATGLAYNHSGEYREWKTSISSILGSDSAYVNVPYDNVTEDLNHFVSGSVGGSITENSNGNWRIMSMDVSAGRKYRVSAQFYSSVKGVFFIDNNNKIVEIQGSEPDDTLHTFDVTVPATAVKMSINDKKSSGFAVKEIIIPVNNERIIIGNANIEELLSGYGNNVGIVTGQDQYLVGTGKMKTSVSLYGSQNGTVNFNSIAYNGETFKGASDDVAPINTDAGYVGANHGYNLVYDAVSSGHGLTENDIGKTCTIDGNTWVLIKIKSASTFVVGCVDSNSVYGLKTVQTVPTTFNFGSSITVTSISREQLRPSVKNININVIKNDSEAFEVTESYDIVTLGDGIEYIIGHVGSNTNDTVIEQSKPAITIRNLYTFDANGTCAIVQNCKVINDDIMPIFCGGTQSNGFGNTDYFAVPETNYDSLSAAGNKTDFFRTTWGDQTKPPMIYCQTDNSANDSSKMMVQGILVDSRNAVISDSAGFIYTTRKMYPYAVQPKSTQETNTTFDFISFRMPIYAEDMNDDFKFCQYCKVRNDYYFFCFSVSETSASISVPAELAGRKIETIVSKNAICHNNLIVDAIDVTANGESYLLLKLSK